MKCPKCNYISFDYNQSCPKCKRDLAEVRERMNLPSFMPRPIPLPGLTGGGPMVQDSDFAAKETAELQFTSAENLDFPSESDVEQKAEEPDLDFSLEDESDDLTLDFDDLAVDGAAPETSKSEQAAEDDSVGLNLDFSLEDETDELSLDFEEPSLSDSKAEIPQADLEIDGQDSIEASLDMVFDEEDEEPSPGPEVMEAEDANTALSQEDEVTEAFDLGDLSIETPGTEPDMEVAENEGQISLDLEESDSLLDENIEFADSDADTGDVQVGNVSSDLEVMDLDLDLEKSDDK